MGQRLTDAFVRTASSGNRQQIIFWDNEIRGLGVRVTSKNAKSFVLDYRAGGRQRRITIGSYPDWSVAAARAEAREMKREVDRGGDPMGERHDDRMAPRVQDLWERYRDEHLALKSPRSQADQTAMWHQLILPTLKAHKVIEVTETEIASLHRWITTDRGTPVRANRTVEVLRKAFNLAIKWKWRSDNPAVDIAKNREELRHRYLTPAELGRLFDVLEGHHERVSANAIKLLALTGARKSEVLSARWEMFDLERQTWVKPAAFTKQRKEHRAPLSAGAISVLMAMKREAQGPFVFPGVNPDQPIKDIKRTWESVCIKAGLFNEVPKKSRAGKTVYGADRLPVMVKKPNVRLHDLRHTFASLLVSNGSSLPLVGALLGHTQTQTTMRYAHLHDDPLREAAAQVDTIITNSRSDA